MKVVPPAIREPNKDRFWRVGSGDYLSLLEATDSLILSGQIGPDQPTLPASVYMAADPEIAFNCEISAIKGHYWSQKAEESSRAYQGLTIASSALALGGLVGTALGSLHQAWPWVGLCLTGAALSGVVAWESKRAMNSQRAERDEYLEGAQRSEELAEEWMQHQAIMSGTLRRTSEAYLFESQHCEPVVVKELPQSLEQVFSSGAPLKVERQEGQVRYNGLSLPKRREAPPPSPLQPLA